MEIKKKRPFCTSFIQNKNNPKTVYIIFTTTGNELILCSNNKGATVWGQAEYAKNILDDMIANGVRPTREIFISFIKTL